jgi:DNA segregation ATPase FtsK/SpoIIIE-like protein
MEKRYKMFADRDVRNIEGYNRFVEELGDPEIEKMPHIVIIIDELADLMMTAPKEVEDSINRIAAKARAAGMHLIIATQRPSVDVVTGVIKANIPTRIAFAVSSQIDSRTILDVGGAERLLGRGDMLFNPVGATKPNRIQGCFVSDEEVESVVDFIKSGGSADYDDNVMVEIERQAAKRNIIMPVLAEINIGKEETKSGILPEQVEEFCAYISEKPHIKLCGLMAIPPKSENFGDNRKYFYEMAKIFIDISSKM